jgi:hypothetical protein
VKILLFGTGSCHLCERAEALLHSTGVAAEYIDIADDEALLEKYAMRIPVVQRVDSGIELDWPFDESALKKLLAQSIIC